MSTSAVKVKARLSPHQSEGQEPEFQGEENCRQQSNGYDSRDRESEGLQCSNVDKDVLLQWGQRKRQRNGRFETKAAAVEESFTLPKKSVKIDRRVAVSDKQAGSIQTQLPLLNRGHAVRACTPLREITCGSEQGNVVAFTTARNVDNGNNCRHQDLQRIVITPVEKTDSGESPCLHDENEMATLFNGSARGNSYPAHAEERVDLEAIQGKLILGVAKVDLESFEWPKFLLALSRKEKEEDFLAIKGCKLPQRPKKRSKHIEKTLHYSSPGLWLCDLTRERYEVREKKAAKKRSRGLKTMGSVDSDSDLGG